MKIDDVREYYESRPFRPFMIHTADGQKVLVDHPEIMILGPDDGLVVVYRRRAGVRIIDADAITQLHVLATPTPRKRRAA